MRDRPLTPWLLGALLLAAAPGCLSFHRYRPLPVLIQDAETKKPIAGVDVHVFYPLTRVSLSPVESTATTGDDGIARLRVAAPDSGLTMEGTAPGYLPEVQSLTGEAIRKIELTHLFEDADRRPASFVMEMYAGPAPTIELVLPIGFRGQVKAEVQVQEDASYPAGQRCFRCKIDDQGEGRLVGPPLLQRVFPPDYRARYADGTAVNPKAGADEVGLRPLKSEGNVQYFLVGTRAEYEELLPPQHPREESLPAGSGRGGRGGGRHRGQPEVPTP
jgi:hypothetical protein